ncbi:MAG: hypothetical protein ACI3X9_02445 [Bacteroidaceae bacterium]
MMQKTRKLGEFRHKKAFFLENILPIRQKGVPLQPQISKHAESTG